MTLSILPISRFSLRWYLHETRKPYLFYLEPETEVIQ